MNLQEALDQEKRKIMLEQLEKFLGNSRNHKLRDALDKFRQHSGIQRVMTNLYNKLLSTKYGQVVKVFHKWHALPERQDSEELKIANEFERRLSNFANKSIRQSFDPLKDI